MTLRVTSSNCSVDWRCFRPTSRLGARNFQGHQSDQGNPQLPIEPPRPPSAASNPRTPLESIRSRNVDLPSEEQRVHSEVIPGGSGDEGGNDSRGWPSWFQGGAGMSLEVMRVVNLPKKNHRERGKNRKKVTFFSKKIPIKSAFFACFLDYKGQNQHLKLLVFWRSGCEVGPFFGWNLEYLKLQQKKGLTSHPERQKSSSFKCWLCPL